jgi:hypothetical protein
MKITHCKCRFAIPLLALFLLTTSGTYAQDEKPRKSVNIGLRVRALPFRDYSVMTSRSLMTTIPAAGGTPARDWSFATATHSAKFGFGGGIEYAPSRRWNVTAEALLNRLSYTKATNIAQGIDDPGTTNDERSHSYVTEDTRGRIWDFPVLLHYRGIRSEGALSKLYLAGGVAVRTVTGLKTSTKVTYSDASTSTSNLVIPPSKRNLVGAVAGIGIRTVDDFHINWMPEIRFTRWAGSTFGLESTISPRNQLELSLGLSFD